MKKNMKHRVLAVSSAVLCVIAMTLSVTVLPGLAYAKITKNPLFAAVLAAAAENNMGQSKSGEGGAGKEGKEVKGDKTKEVDKKEGNRAAKGGAAKDSERVDNKGSNGNSENPNVVGSVSNSNSNGNGAGDTTVNGAKSGKDANGENKKPNVPANAPKNKSTEKGKQVDKGKKNNKANGKDAKEKAKKKAKGKDRSTGAMEKLSLDDVKKLPACEAYVFKDQFDNASIRFRPSSGPGNKCAISADGSSSNFDSIRQEISKLGDSGPVNFSDVYVYAYGSLSKDHVGLFSGKNISNIDSINNFDISYVTDMSYLFKNSSLTDFSFLSGWDVSNVTNMESMFEGCTNLDDISGLSKWNVGNVRNMEGMFASVIKDENKRDSFDPEGYEGLMAIKSLKPLSNWNVGNVGDMNRMFEGCTRLKDFTGLEKWDTKNVSSMIGMFRYCNGIGKDKIKCVTNEGGAEKCTTEPYDALEPFVNWNVSRVTDMRGMFAVCTYIQNTVGLENWNVSNVTKMDDMFAMCTNLNSIKGLSNWNKTNSSSESKLTSTSRMFYQCSSLTSLDPLSSWNVGSVKDMHDMFNNCGSLTKLDPLSSWNVGKVTDMSSMFSSCTGLTSIEPLSGWAREASGDIKASNVSNVTNMSSMFSGCKHLKSLKGLKNWTVSNVTKMSSMFSGCYDYDLDEEGHVTSETGLADISALSGWNVSNVTDMSSMFSDCGVLSSLSGLEKWDVSSVKNMGSMFSHFAFSGDDKLADISALSGWNVSNVTDMSNMFNSCKSLKSIAPLSGWAREASGDIKASNVSNVKDMSSMFSDCQSLTGDADLSKWDISKVTNLSSMFSGVGAESGNKLVLDFSNKTFTKPSDPNSHFSVDSMFDGFKGTLIANNLQSDGFENNTEDDPIKSHFAKGEIFSKDDNDLSKSDNIVVTNNVTILSTISSDDKLKKIAYYIPVKAKLMEPGEMGSCKCDGSGDSGGTTYTYYVPALYNSSNLEKKQDEKSQDYAYRVVKNSFASKFRSAIDSQSGKEPGGDEPVDVEGGDDNGDSRSAKQELRVKKLRSARESRSVRDGEGEGNTKEKPNGEQGNTYKIMFKKPAASGDTCSWTELGEGENGAVPVSEPKSPLIFFTTMYYLETFVQPVPLPHTGGQSAVMFTFLSIGLFSMFAVAGAFGRHGWVVSVLPSTALAGFSKACARRSS
ncbi:BspA family leucine-rich repeat surface protein [Gardnerella vaginalis]|uniref:BspA family leucine-rich repeat surface protein n=1 Tax=Gardnerella vaginalis TaxID=2702 RepID=UPI003970C1AF